MNTDCYWLAAEAGDIGAVLVAGGVVGEGVVEGVGVASVVPRSQPPSASAASTRAAATSLGFDEVFMRDSCGLSSVLPNGNACTRPAQICESHAVESRIAALMMPTIE
jgi:hypothetical protein